jgi:hypothetical protein
VLRPALIALVLAVHGAAAGPVVSAGPTVGGGLQQGKQLVVTPGTWTGTGAVAYAYQWYRCDANGAHCSSIHGATRATYTQVARDAGGALGVTVLATDSTGTTPAYAPLAGLVASAKTTLLAAAQPVTSGTPSVGQVVTVAPVKWSATATSSYAWERCNANGRLCATIAGATAQSYTGAAADLGFTLLAAVTGTAGVQTQTVLSLPTGVVRAAAGPSPAARPSVRGTLQQGQQLTGRIGTWLGSGPLTYAYQWSRCDANAAHCQTIRGATRPSYVQVAKDAGKTLGLAVRATDTTGTVTAYAPVTGVVAPAGATVVATGQPTLMGKVAAGQTLTVKPGTWSGHAPKLTYTWQRCNVNGRACTGIADAAGVHFALTAADAGHTIVAAAHTTEGLMVLSVASSVVT